MAHAIRTTSLLNAPSILIPLFLCPSLVSSTSSGHNFGGQRRRHKLHVDATATIPADLPSPSQLLSLPRSCPGCGAFTQTVSPEQPGFYGTNRKSVKAFVSRNGQHPGSGNKGEQILFERVLGAADASLLSQVGLKGVGENEKTSQI